MLNFLEEIIKEHKKIIFCFFAILPFFIADIVLRYSLNPIVLNQFRYNAIPVLFSVFWVMLFVYFCWGILPEKIGRIVYLVLVNLFGAWFFANYLCFKILSRFLWLEDIFLAGEASDYIASVFTYINIKTIICIIIYLASVIIAYRMWEKPQFNHRYIKYIPLDLCILGIICVQIFMNVSIKKDKEVGAWEVWEKPTLVYDKFQDSNKSLGVAGFYQYTLKNFYRMVTKSKLSLADEQTVIDYFENKNIKDNEMTGILKDKNVIFVLMESMDDWIINEKYTPTIKYMMDNGINFKNHYMPNVGMGYTFNAEFAANTGYYCPSSESSASIFTKNAFPYSLGNILKNMGYRTASFHYNTKDFYNREAMHKRFGYDKYVSFMKYLSIEKCVQDTEAVKSDELYDMMTKTENGEKFLDFIITYSAHLPYNIEDNKLKGAKENYSQLIDENISEELNNLYLLAHDTDEFFKLLLKMLKEDGIFEDTVIIGFTDHYAYGVQDYELLKEMTLNVGSEIFERVPFFIYSPGLEHKTVEKVTSAIDIMPTIANLLGAEDRRYYVGNDAFDASYNGIVYFPDGKWYDGNILFEPNSDTTYTDEERQYIINTNKYIDDIKSISDYVVSTNYFARHSR